MKQLIAVILVTIVGLSGAQAQKYVTKTGHIYFFASTPMENIEAHNHQVNSALDQQTGDFVFKVLMKSFQFERALMQEHFNENYVESDKYPNASFIGIILNISDINFSKNGVYNATVEGNLTIKGVTKKITEKGTFEVKEGKVIGNSSFNIVLSDYNIEIPGAVADKISKTFKIDVAVNLEKFAK